MLKFTLNNINLTEVIPISFFGKIMNIIFLKETKKKNQFLIKLIGAKINL